MHYQVWIMGTTWECVDEVDFRNGAPEAELMAVRALNRWLASGIDAKLILAA